MAFTLSRMLWKISAAGTRSAQACSCSWNVPIVSGGELPPPKPPLPPPKAITESWMPCT